MTAFHRLLAQNLRAVRESYGWSREKLSEVTGISANFLSEIEAGLKFPRPENLEKLCEALRIQPADLFMNSSLTTSDPSQGELRLAARLKDKFSSWVDSQLAESDLDQAAEAPS